MRVSSGDAQREFWVAHAFRVLVSASRRNELPNASDFVDVFPFVTTRKFAKAGRLRQHARRVRYPDAAASTFSIRTRSASNAASSAVGGTSCSTSNTTSTFANGFGIMNPSQLFNCQNRE